jgi:putative ABC transport system ATP-binding protein
MESIVAVHNLTRRYALDHSFVSALEDVTFEIGRGAFLAVAGPSGSGKSTLLNLIGCLDQPTAGRVRIEGQETTELGVKALSVLRRKKIGFVFQTFNLIPVFTAYENVEYPLLLQGAGTAERRERVRQALESVGLAERMKQRPDLLSGGERQRVAVARAIVHRPALVLADEATANLDTRNATQLIDLMRQLNRELGITFLFATHDQRLLDRADRVLWLCDGRLQEVQGSRSQVPGSSMGATPPVTGA